MCAATRTECNQQRELEHDTQATQHTDTFGCDGGAIEAHRNAGSHGLAAPIGSYGFVR